MRKIVGVTIFAVIWMGVMSLSNPAAFIDVPSLIVIIGSTCGLTLISCRKGADGKTVLERIKRYSVYSGWMAFLVGLTAYFSQGIAEVDYKVVAVCLVSLVYGYMASMITDCFI